MRDFEIHIRSIKRANSRRLMELTGGFNTLSFVQDMRDKGVSNKEITKFFLFLAKSCLAKDVLLPRKGYMDMVRFSADHGLLKD